MFTLNLFLMTLVVMMAVELQHMMMMVMVRMMVAVWVVLGVLDMHSATGASV